MTAHATDLARAALDLASAVTSGAPPGRLLALAERAADIADAVLDGEEGAAARPERPAYVTRAARDDYARHVDRDASDDEARAAIREVVDRRPRNVVETRDGGVEILRGGRPLRLRVAVAPPTPIVVAVLPLHGGGRG